MARKATIREKVKRRAREQRDRMVETAQPKRRVYKVRPGCSNEWLICPSHADLARAIDDIADEDGVHADVEVGIAEMTDAELEALPEFGGW